MENIKDMSEKKTLCVVSCPISTRSGYGARSRDFVRALGIAKPNWDIKILSQRWGSTAMDALKVGEDDDLLEKVITKAMEVKPDVWIQITVPNEFQPVGHYNIGLTAGVETTIMPAECLQGINRMDMVLVSSNFTKEVIEKTIFEKKDEKTKQTVGTLKCEVPIKTLFEGIDLEVYDEKAPSEPRIDVVLRDIKESFCFLFVGHWLNGNFSHDRKNVSGMIYTFLNVFKGKHNPPALLLKVSGGGTSILDRIRIKSQIESIKKRVIEDSGNVRLPNIYLLHSDITDWEMNALYNHPKVKAHISFTRGEGFGRPLLEATISGKPMIVPAWSGHMDFINPEYVNAVTGKLDTVDKSASNAFLLESASWFTIDYNVAGSVMKDMYDNYKPYLEKARKHRKYSKDNFSFDKMIELLKEVIIDSDIERKPRVVGLTMPTLKRKEAKGSIKLPTLKRKEDKPQAIKLPKLKKK